MEDNEYKKKICRFRRRMKTEAGIRAGSLGMAVGLAVMAAVLLYGRLRYERVLLAEAGIAALAVAAAVALLAYFVWLRPKNKEVLARIDSLGLQERMITMEELKLEETVIAKAQRQDAKEHLKKLGLEKLKLKMYIKPLLCSVLLAAVVLVLGMVPFKEKEEDPLAVQNAKEMAIIDDLITALTETVEQSAVQETYKAELKEIIEALSVSFTAEDSTLTRTAKIATASKRLDMYVAEQQDRLTLQKQQLDGSEEMKLQVMEATEEQFRLSRTVENMKTLMGTSIEVLNMVEGTFWSPEEPDSEASSDEEQQGEEPPEGEEQPPEEMEPGEEQPPEGMEPGEDGEFQEGMEGEMLAGTETIFDPEMGEVSYGTVYEEYYQAILKALTEQEYSEEIREIIEDYANSLE